MSIWLCTIKRCVEMYHTQYLYVPFPHSTLVRWFRLAVVPTSLQTLRFPHYVMFTEPLPVPRDLKCVIVFRCSLNVQI